MVDTGRVDRVTLVQPETVSEKEPKPTTWALEIFDYNSDARIVSPDAEGTAATGIATAAATSATTTDAASEATKSP